MRQKVRVHSMFSKSGLKITEKVGCHMIYLNIYNKYYFSNFTLLSTRDVLYCFFKQNVVTRSIETPSVIISKLGCENWDCSTEIFSDRRRLGNARLKQTFIFYCIVCARSPTHTSALLVSSCAPGTD